MKPTQRFSRFCMPFCILTFSMTASLTVHAQESPQYDTLLPQDIIYFHQSNTLEKDAFPNFYNALKAWSETLDDILEWRVLKSEWDALTATLPDDSSLSSLCGDSYAFALSGFGDGGKIPNIVYLSYVDDPDTATQVLTHLFKQVADIHEIIQYEQDFFRNVEIHSLYGPGNIPGLGLAFTHHENLLILSTSKPYLTEWIDRVGFTENTLANSDVYQDALSRLPQNHRAHSFLNLTQFTASLEELLKMGSAIQEMEQDQNLKTLLDTAAIALEYGKKFHYYASAQLPPIDHVYQKTNIVRYDPSITETPFGSLFQHTPDTFNFTSFLPRNTGSFFQGNLFSLPETWNLYQNILTLIPDSDQKNQMTDTLKQFEENMGISIENDLLSWIGEDWAWVKPVMKLDAIIPTNELAFMFSVHNEEKAKTALQKLLSLLTKDMKIPVTVENTNYRGMELTTLKLPIPLISFSPGWTVDKDLLILSTHDRLIREMLDVQAGVERGIDRNRYFNQLKPHILKPANLTQFQDIESEFYTYREALKRVTSFSNLGSELLPNEEMPPFQIMERISYLISCFQVMKATVKRNRISSDEWHTENFTLMQDLSSVPNLQIIQRGKFSLGAKEAIIQLAAFLIQAGQEERAKRIYAVLEEFYPDDKEYLLDAAKAYQESGKPEEADQMLRQAAETSNHPSVFIELAKTHDFQSAAEVEEWLNTLVQDHSDINRTAVLMGIALHKAAQDDPTVAHELFRKIAEQNDDPLLQQAAQNELARDGALNGDAIFIQVPLVTVYPTIDGYKDNAWGDDAEKSLIISSFENELTLHLSRSGAQLYCLAEMQAPSEGVKAESFHLYLCTNRQYHPVHQLTVQRTGSDDSSGVIKHAKARIIDPWNMFPDASGEPFLHTNWPVGHGYDDHTRTFELSFPLSLVTDEHSDTLWAINAHYTVEYESDESYSAWLRFPEISDTPDDPFGYLLIDMR